MQVLDFSLFVNHHLVKAKAHIQNDNLFAAADGGHISPDLVIPANGDYLNIHYFPPIISSSSVESCRLCKAASPLILQDFVPRRGT